MEKINCVGNRYFAHFEKDGAIIEEEITPEEYANPHKDGYVFIDAEARAKYDSSDGTLQVGQYTDMGDFYLVHLAGCDLSLVAKEKLVNGILDPAIQQGILDCQGKEMKIWQ